MIFSSKKSGFNPKCFFPQVAQIIQSLTWMKLTLKFYLNISWSMFADSPKIMSSCWKLEWNLLILIVDFGPVFYTLTMIWNWKMCTNTWDSKKPLDSNWIIQYSPFLQIGLKWAFLELVTLLRSFPIS